MEQSVIDEACFNGCVSRLRNWAAPGPDGVQGFWIKRFTALRSVIISHFNNMLKDGSLIPSWFPKGKTILIPKASDTEQPKNFRPITCLNILYKLWTGCISEVVLRHCVVNNVLHPAQKGCVRGEFGCTDHLLLNSHIWKQVKSKNRSLSVAWLGYKKAYDSVPHNWIVCSLKLFRFDTTIVQCIEQLLSLWSTTLYLRMPTCDPVMLAAVSIKRGIFQGDTLSPLLFCLTLTPLSMLLDSLSGYQATTTRRVNHLLYMDDIKLFAKSDIQLERLLHTVYMFSNDVCLTFGLDKCAKSSVVRGKVVSSDDVPLSDTCSIRVLGVGESYKYLGFYESDGLDCVKSKEMLTDLYNHRLKLVWSSLLSGPRKTRATNSFCVPLLSFGFGIVPWTKKEIQQFDVSTRRILSATNNHHPRSAIERIYLPRSAGGVGLVNIENLYNRKLVSLAHHLSVSSDPLVLLCCEIDSDLPRRSSVLFRAREYCASLSVTSDFQNILFSSLKSLIRDCQFSRLMSSIIDKPLHGQYYALLNKNSIDKTRSVCWLKSHVHSESESTILAIQNQAITTRVLQVKIMKMSIPSIMCRLCGEHEESVVHLLAACPSLAATAYLYRHNLVAGVVHWHLMRLHGFLPGSSCWFTHRPPAVVESSVVKILWDFSLQSASHYLSNRPDIVLFDYDLKKIYFIEVSCPADVNVPSKEQEKLQKYQSLAHDYHMMYRMPVIIIPVVVGCTGVVSSNCITHLRRIPDFSNNLFVPFKRQP